MDPLWRHCTLISLGAEKRDVDRRAVSTFYNYYLNIVGEYYMHIICVFTKIRGLYSGLKPFIKTVVVACGYRLQIAATEANGNAKKRCSH